MEELAVFDTRLPALKGLILVFITVTWNGCSITFSVTFFQLVHFFSPLPGCLSPNQACFRGCLFVTKSGSVLLAVYLSPSQALFSWLFVCHQVRLCSRGCLFVTKSGSVLVAVCLSPSQAVF